MNTSTENLENDHVHILKLIEVMGQIVNIENPDTTHLEEIVFIIRNFADGLHHAKEENLLFPLMADKGFSMQQGPIAVMLMDHEQGRGFVRGMAENIQRYKDGQSGALNLIRENMNGYCELLISHISKENNVLFRMADNVFTRENHETLLTQFSEIEAGAASSLAAQDYINRIDTLAGIYLKTN